MFKKNSLINKLWKKINKKTVLVLDTDQRNREALELNLKLKGYSPITASYPSFYNSRRLKRKKYSIAIIGCCCFRPQFFLDVYDQINAKRKFFYSCGEDFVKLAKEKGLEAYCKVKPFAQILGAR
jgi:hypothetical protein